MVCPMPARAIAPTTALPLQTFLLSYRNLDNSSLIVYDNYSSKCLIIIVACTVHTSTYISLYNYSPVIVVCFIDSQFVLVCPAV